MKTFRNNLPGWPAFIVSIGLIFILLLDDSISSKNDSIESYNHKIDINFENLRMAKNEYSVAYRTENHIDLLTLLNADTTTINNKRDALITFMRNASILSNNLEEDANLLQKIKKSETFGELSQIYASGVSDRSKIGNNYVGEREEIRDKKKRLERIKSWSICILIFLSIVAFVNSRKKLSPSKYYTF